MNLKLLALAGIMTATMGLTACDSKKEEVVDAQEEVVDAQEDVVDAQADVVDAQADVQADAAEADIAQAQDGTATSEVDAEVPVDGTTTGVDTASETPAVDAADEVVVEEPAQ